jgi:hypothetical protein
MENVSVLFFLFISSQEGGRTLAFLSRFSLLTGGSFSLPILPEIALEVGNSLCYTSALFRESRSAISTFV